MTQRRFSKSFRPEVNLEPGEPCSLKHHYRGAMREVIGILDLLAGNDPERFVFCEVQTIVRMCHRYKSTRNFTQRWLEMVFKELRARHIVSHRLLRIRFGIEHPGFIVAPHDALAVRASEKQCILKGQLRVSGKWKRDIKLLDDAGKVLDAPEIGPVFWASSVDSSVRSSVRSSVDSSVRSSVDHSAQEDKDKKVNPEKARDNRGNSPLTVEAGVAVLSGVAVVAAQDKPREEEQQQKSSGSFSSSFSDEGEKSKSVFEHFEGFPVFATLAEVSGDRLRTQTEEWQDFGYENEERLLGICRDVLLEIRNEQWDGDMTRGRIMDEAATRFIAKHGGPVPRSWLKVRTDLNPEIRKRKG